MKKFKNLKVWQKGMDLVKNVYKSSKNFPKEELFGLTSQIRRSAISIPSNVAEGSGRGTDKDFKRFLDIAVGSSYELETQIIIANELKFLSENDFNDLSLKVNEIQKMIAGLHKSLK
ncbi:MAG: four helix bundle protein [Prolixibacteraceae bacterium]|jgi:four helix bundle protein|nr:four helix bundle protein [Prolixibacteraceae bacterium]MBT6004388.1 four helix bundle protein [Prolixibacteraceae bacterium]MBT6765744.1 four helix bundle protein [Prolixibacteraceae bacterium]MBT6998511.1 four helix bundle protein [Prolixibacteraceae bacterium]MBT7397152.1 four helix bundle protein [Prolixibacteraceae bacterium]